jgi:hypothetical protein
MVEDDVSILKTPVAAAERESRIIPSGTWGRGCRFLFDSPWVGQGPEEIRDGYFITSEDAGF